MHERMAQSAHAATAPNPKSRNSKSPKKSQNTKTSKTPTKNPKHPRAHKKTKKTHLIDRVGARDRGLERHKLWLEHLDARVMRDALHEQQHAVTQRKVGREGGADARGELAEGLCAVDVCGVVMVAVGGGSGGDGRKNMYE